MKKFIKPVAHVAVALCFCFLLTGCDLIDLVKKVIYGSYRSSTKISILVYPPFPLMQNKKDYDDEDKFIKSFSASESAKQGLMNGVAQFNEVSSSTTIIPIFYGKIDPVIEFYRDIFKNIKDQTKVKKICRNKIFDVRDNSEYKTASCIIFGIFEYKETATVYNISLCFYDYANDKWAMTYGVVTKTPGRAQEADLQNLMKVLLKKVYD